MQVETRVVFSIILGRALDILLRVI
jgi:hypothetical protein